MLKRGLRAPVRKAGAAGEGIDAIAVAQRPREARVHEHERDGVAVADVDDTGHGLVVMHVVTGAGPQVEAISLSPQPTGCNPQVLMSLMILIDHLMNL